MARVTSTELWGLSDGRVWEVKTDSLFRLHVTNIDPGYVAPLFVGEFENEAQLLSMLQHNLKLTVVLKVREDS